MQLTSLSNPYSIPASPRKKCIKEEIDFRDREESDISKLWKVVTVLGYFVVLLGGIVTSISIGSLLAAFNNNCILYATVIVKGLDEIAAKGGNLTLYDENIVLEEYGPLGDCTFAEYCSVASSVIGGVWGILFLQCGRGGITKKSQSPSWHIVPPALLTNVVFFILSCIIFAKTTGGLSYFCNHLRSETDMGGPAQNITTCKDILAFHFPTDLFDTNLYLNYILAQVSSFMTFFGWLVTLFVLILRCFIPVDFTVYTRKLYKVSPEQGYQTNGQSRTMDDDNLPSTSTCVVDNFGNNVVATTSFSIKKSSSPKAGHSKKLS